MIYLEIELPQKGLRLVDELSEYFNTDRETMLSGRKMPYIKGKRVFMYYLTQELNWSLNKTAKICNLTDHSTIIHGIRRVMEDFKDPHLLGLYYRSQRTFRKVQIPREYMRTKKNGVRAKKVSQYTDTGELIKTWNSIDLAANSIDVSRQAIQQACKWGTSSGGYKWKIYETDSIRR